MVEALDDLDISIDIYALYNDIEELYNKGEFVTLYQEGDLAGIYFDMSGKYNRFLVVDEEARLPNYFVINGKTNKVEAALSTEMDLKQYVEHFGSLSAQVPAGFVSPLKDATPTH